MKRYFWIGAILLGGTLWAQSHPGGVPVLKEDLLSESLREAASLPELGELKEFSDFTPLSPGIVDVLLSAEVEKKLPAEVLFAARQAVAERLTRDEAYDEALRLFEKLPETASKRPETLLFFRGVAEHQLLMKPAFENTMKALAAYEKQLPKRYASLVEFMRKDFETLNEKGLDHISRRMKDVRRRLDLGRTDEPVQKIEEDIIQSLDETIEKMEKEQQKRQKKRRMSAAPTPGGKPLDDARIMGGRGPGKVDGKKHDDRGAWGNLPPKERERSLQEIGTDFPPHYRDVIEQYFKRMAEQ
ncbi:MAG: hypothetical protein Q4D98_13095 [Planctomycetia bacterium]|nr:hypothetical protein [Planctomycetia bacterium]